MTDNIWTMTPHGEPPVPGEAPELRLLSLPREKGELELAFRLRKGSKCAAVFLHGLGCSQRSFAGVWKHPDLASATLLTLDLPGFGDSARPSDFRYRLEDHAAMVVALLQRLELGAVHLVGHSMGGAVAVLAAGMLHKQGLLAGLASVEGNLIAADCGVSRVAAGMTQQRFEERFFPDFKKRTTALHRAYMALELAAPHAFYKTSDSLWSWARSEKLLRKFLKLDCPRLYVHGRRDKNLPVLDRLEDIERRAIPDSGHFPMNENPGEFYRALAQWLAG